jgi:hypothetical protein
VLCTRSAPRSYKEDSWGDEVSSVRESVEKGVRRGPPFTEDLRAEAQQSPMLEAVTRERVVKI